MDFHPQIILSDLFRPLARGAVAVMPSKLRRYRWIAGLGLWGSAKELRRHFDDTEQTKDRHTHRVAIEGASAVLSRLAIPCPPNDADPEIWREFLSHIILPAAGCDISRCRAMLNELGWTSPDAPPEFAAPSPEPASSVEERIFTSQTAAELFASVEHLTQLEMERVVAPHIGKWLRVQSVIQEMTEDELFLYVTLGTWAEPNPVLRFNKEGWESILETMSRGQTLAAHGKIHSIGLMRMRLTSCEVVEEEGENESFRLPDPGR